MSEKVLQENYKAIEAHENLKLLWFIRGFVSLFGAAFLAYVLLIGLDGSDEEIHPVAGTAMLLLLLIELFFIAQFYRGKQSGLYGLHAFSALYILNFPLGTAFSVYHYVKSRHLVWH